jgi:hypothetical protein
MSSVRFAVLPLCATLAAPPPSLLASAGPQEPPRPAAVVPTFAVTTAAVTLDVVVRDRRDRAVRDLTARDFEVYEDGVLQRIESFEVFGRRAGRAGSPRRRPSPLPQRPPRRPQRPAATRRARPAAREPLPR